MVQAQGDPSFDKTPIFEHSGSPTSYTLPAGALPSSTLFCALRGTRLHAKTQESPTYHSSFHFTFHYINDSYITPTEPQNTRVVSSLYSIIPRVQSDLCGVWSSTSIIAGRDGSSVSCTNETGNPFVWLSKLWSLFGSLL